MQYYKDRSYFAVTMEFCLGYIQFIREIYNITRKTGLH
jgi:hypothetical protein